MRPAQTTLPTAAAAALLLLLSGLALTSGCNKALCASDVSKCLIQVKHTSPNLAQQNRLLVLLPKQPGARAGHQILALTLKCLL